MLAYTSAGTLYIDGGNGVDTVIVSTTGGTSKYSTPLKYVVNHNGVVQSFSMLSVSAQKIVFRGNAGNDTFTNNTGLNCTADGGDGNDTLVGGWGDDTLIGNNGMDTIDGRDGRDTIHGDKAISTVVTPGQIDTLNGGDGDDLIYGGGANDVISGGRGSDRLYGEDGNDHLMGNEQVDWLFGGFGNDTLMGGYDNDKLFGEEDDDLLMGESGDDALNGGAGIDTLSHTDNSSMILTDTDFWCLGHDTLSGVEKARLIGGVSANRLDARGFSGNADLWGLDGKDTLLGGSGIDKLYGGEGDDWLEAGTLAELAEGGGGVDFNAHMWVVGGTNATDIAQQEAGTCAILSALAGAVEQGHDLASRISYIGDFTYIVRLFDPNAGWREIGVHFDGALVMDSDGKIADPIPVGVDVWAGCQEFWPILYQRAYASYFLGIDPLDGDAMNAFQGENGIRPLQAVTGQSVESLQFDSFHLDFIGQEYVDAIGAGIGAVLGYGQTVMLGAFGHAYAVTSIYLDGAGDWRITVYNPYAQDETTNRQLPFNGLGLNDGLLELSLIDFIEDGNSIYWTA